MIFSEVSQTLPPYIYFNDHLIWIILFERGTIGLLLKSECFHGVYFEDLESFLLPTLVCIQHNFVLNVVGSDSKVFTLLLTVLDKLRVDLVEEGLVGVLASIDVEDLG